MRTLSAAIQSHLSGTSHNRCNMLLLILTNGTQIGLTDHDKNIEDFDLDLLNADGLSGTRTFDAGTGILSSNLSLSASLDADNYEVSGPIGDTFSFDAILGGLFNNARAYRFEINWKSPSDGVIAELAGNVTEARVEGGKFTMEIRSDMDFFNRTVGRLITNQCDADFGDSRCQATPTTATGTVTSVTDAMQFTVAFSGSFADNFFNMGTVTGLTGTNAGLVMEIESWTALGAIVLFAPLVEAPAVGDTFTLKNGCSKLRKSSDASVPTCLTYDNVINFRGYPEVPGSDQVLRMPIPGGGGN